MRAVDERRPQNARCRKRCQLRSSSLPAHTAVAPCACPAANSRPQSPCAQDNDVAHELRPWPHNACRHSSSKPVQAIARVGDPSPGFMSGRLRVSLNVRLSVRLGSSAVDVITTFAPRWLSRRRGACCRWWRSCSFSGSAFARLVDVGHGGGGPRRLPSGRLVRRRLLGAGLLAGGLLRTVAYRALRLLP